MVRLFIDVITHGLNTLQERTQNMATIEKVRDRSLARIVVLSDPLNQLVQVLPGPPHQFGQLIALASDAWSQRDYIV